MFGIGKKKEELSLREFVAEMRKHLDEFESTQDGANEFCRSKHGLKAWAWHFVGYIKKARGDTSPDDEKEGDG